MMEQQKEKTVTGSGLSESSDPAAGGRYSPQKSTCSPKATKGAGSLKQGPAADNGVGIVTAGGGTHASTRGRQATSTETLAPMTRSQAEVKYCKLLENTMAQLEALEAAVQAAPNTKLDVKNGVKTVGAGFREFANLAMKLGIVRTPDAQEQRMKQLQQQQQQQHLQTTKVLKDIQEDLSQRGYVTRPTDSLAEEQSTHTSDIEARLAEQSAKIDSIAKLITKLDTKSHQEESNGQWSDIVLKKTGSSPAILTGGHQDEMGWETVQSKNPKRPRSPRKGKREEERIRNRSDVVIVQTKPENYSEVLKKIKSGVNMDAIGNKISALRQTRSGGILIQVTGGPTAADVVRAEVTKIVETDTLVRTPKQQTLVEFRGLDSLTDTDELVNQIVVNADTPQEAVKVLSMRKTYGETQSALVLMPWDSAAKITKAGRIRVGLVYCSTRICKKRKRCFRCLKFGHESRTCSGIDKSNCCRRCGIPDHQAVNCKASIEDAAVFRRSLFQDPQSEK